MKALIIYDSVYGNTEEIAEAIATVFQQYGHVRVVAASTVTVLDFMGINLLAIGGPTQKHGLSPVLEDVLDRILPARLSSIPAVTFDTRLHMNSWLSGSAADRIAKRLRKYEVSLLLPPESFFVEGKEGPLEKGEVERAARWAHTILERVGAVSIPVGS